MKSYKRETQPKTAEEYREKAAAYQQEYKNQWKTFLRCGVLMTAASIVMFVVSMAWFANNSRVGANGISLSADNGNFALRSYGQNGIYDEDILAQFFEIIKLGMGDSSSHTTTGLSQSISWLVSGDSNLGNYSQDDVDFTQSDRKDFAIEPGSEGRLTFYIVPGGSGTQTFDLQLAITPYAAVVDEETKKILTVTEVGGTDDSDTNQYARQFLAGHVLFFLEKETTDEAEQYCWIKDETFSVTIEDAEAGEEYGYTLYWKWPQVFSEVILNAGDAYLNGRTPILTKALREEILADMTDYPQKYFYNSLKRAPLSAKDSLVKEISEIHEKSPVSGGTGGYYAQNFVDLSSFYNQADQIIGSQISFIMVGLTVETGGTDQ
jgi:hypothetical protein